MGRVVALLVGALVLGWLFLSSPSAEFRTQATGRVVPVQCQPLGAWDRDVAGLSGPLYASQEEVVRDHVDALSSTVGGMDSADVTLAEERAEAAVLQACDVARQERLAGLVLVAVPVTAVLGGLLTGGRVRGRAATTTGDAR